ncbi:nicotinate phosphoribosyltransferase [bacterium]|nr:nicotinate phosphoribosyltransferase [bacterium]
MQLSSNFITPLLTDFYQLTMAYAYWKGRHHEDRAVFDLIFRKNPFGGEFSLFTGLEDVLRFIEAYCISDEQLGYIRHTLPGCEAGFFDWLKGVNCRDVMVHAIPDGTIVMPRVPLLRVEGPLGITQLLETTLLNLVNFACLIATNAARFRIAAGDNKILLEFGLRRSQGPDGGMSASKYSYIGGFDGTSNVQAGSIFAIPIRGTHAHSFVQSFSGLGDLNNSGLVGPNGQSHDFVEMVLAARQKLEAGRTNEGELAAFIGYAQSFPAGFLALVDTYDTIKSGVPNFLCVATALKQIGYEPIGIRLDSGDLAFLSKAARRLFRHAEQSMGLDFSGCQIVASNDINESVLVSLNQQGHEIDMFGIGTHLVTCQAQPAFGGVYKLVELNGHPRIKLSQDISKVTIPGKKEAYRLVGADGFPLADLMIRVGEDKPVVGKKVFCRHPFDERKRVNVIPTEVIPLHRCVWDGKINYRSPNAQAIRTYVHDQITHFRKDHLRLLNPTPYKVSVSNTLFNYMHDLWTRESPIDELS